MRLEQQEYESAKKRALRIPLDYVHRSDSVQRWKWIVTGIATLMTAGYGLWLMLGTNGTKAFSHGPVARAHAAWDADCSACHLDFVALREDAANPLVRFGLVSIKQDSAAGSQIHPGADRKCQTCHRGPPHHRNELTTDAKSCVHCHTDHRGRNADIARPTDSHCTRCHQDIVAHRLDGKSATKPEIENVARFSNLPTAGISQPHPDFRSLKSDPGNVKFNHAMHMTAGIPAPDKKAQGAKLLTLGDKSLEQYRRLDQPQGQRSDRDYLVQLECGSCHRADETDLAQKTQLGKSQFLFPTSGAYMLPVQYSRDCGACHPLNYEPLAGREMTHGLTPPAMREFLLGRFLLESKSGQLDDSATRLVPRRVIPGRSSNPPGEPQDRAIVDQRVAAAERYLQENKVCSKCHSYVIAGAAADSTLPRNIEPSNIPKVWLKHARFDHLAHRSVNCRQCHVQAFPAEGGGKSDPAAGPHDQDVVMIAGQTVCLNCHTGRSPEKPQGGARFDCVECHRYHSAEDE